MRLSDESAGDLVERLGLAAPLVEPSAPADQGTGEDCPCPEGARGPPEADGEPVNSGVDYGGAAVVVLLMPKLF